MQWSEWQRLVIQFELFTGDWFPCGMISRSGEFFAYVQMTLFVDCECERVECASVQAFELAKRDWTIRLWGCGYWVDFCWWYDGLIEDGGTEYGNGEADDEE